MARILPPVVPNIANPSDGCGTLGTLGIDLVYFPAYENRERRMHSVDALLLSCILGGKGTHFIESDQFDETGSSISVINYGQTHDIVTDGPMEVMNLFLDFERLAIPTLPFELRGSLPSVISLHRNLQHRLNRVVHLPFDKDGPIRSILITLREELRRRRVGYGEVWRALLQTLLIFCMRTARETGIAPVASEWDAGMERVRQYIASNFAEPLTLELLADVAGMSRAYLCRRFKKYTGQSVFTYVLDRRIESAMVRLRATDDKIVTVALESGFGDVAFFNRKFRERIGTSPGRYREPRGS